MSNKFRAKFTGIENVIIGIGEEISLLDGVKAIDEVYGDITSKIKVNGSVDNNKAGEYYVDYKVLDCDGTECIITRKITVFEEKKEEEIKNFDITKVYSEGDIVLYNNQKYLAKAWSQAQYPEKSKSWEHISEKKDDDNLNIISVEFIPFENLDKTQADEYGKGIYSTEGIIISYKGKLYEAQCFTDSIPGSDDTWKCLNEK